MPHQRVGLECGDCPPAGHGVFERIPPTTKPAPLKALVRDHFAILKVGPGLTFALREALWALDAIEREWIADAQRAHLRAATTPATRLHAEPKYWQHYYHAQGEQLHIDLQYSLSDRIRYYWPDAAIEAQHRSSTRCEQPAAVGTDWAIPATCPARPA